MPSLGTHMLNHIILFLILLLFGVIIVSLLIMTSSYHMNDAYWGNLKKMMNDMTEKIIETTTENMLQYFNQLRENDNVHNPNFSLGFLKN